MSPKAAIWLRVAGGSGIAALLLFALSPARPTSRLPWLEALLLGACSGGLLYGLVSRRRPQLPALRRSPAVLVARLGIVGLLAADEELVWRRVVLGELLFRGAPAALAASSLGFALVHSRRQALHLGTGATFGGLYLGTGALAASVLAHWVYNILVGARADRSRSRVGTAP